MLLGIHGGDRAAKRVPADDPPLDVGELVPRGLEGSHGQEADAEGLLRRLIAENDPSRKNACYILALMLERKKMLRPVESRDEDMLVYEHVVTGETIVIANPHLSLEQIPDVQREVGALLEHGF